jgi:hypothetical protein
MRVITPKGLYRNLSNARLTLRTKARHEWGIGKAIRHDKLTRIQVARGEYCIFGPQSPIEDMWGIKLYMNVKQ